jgi:hypothetical protein
LLAAVGSAQRLQAAAAAAVVPCQIGRCRLLLLLLLLLLVLPSWDLWHSCCRRGDTALPTSSRKLLP